MLTSDRRFGIEIEFFCPNKTSLYRVGQKMKLVEDGSIRHIPFSAEYVSGILQGKSGEKTVQTVCEILKKQGASGDEPCMSVHVHLDGKKNAGTVVSAKEIPPISGAIQSRIYAISDKVAKNFTSKTIEELVRDGFLNYNGDALSTSKIDGVIYLSLAKITAHPTKHFTYFWYEKQNRFNWLRNVLYFYTKYSQVMEDIVASSRKFGNMYCIPLGASYDLDKIESCSDMNELKNLWYKGRPSTGHYDDSRYHNVNLHSFWDRHGTVEIRSHGGSVDPHKILLWTRLHQKIVDKLETMTIDDIKTDGNLHKNFTEFVEEPILQDYVKRLLGFYSGIIIKD